MYMQACIRTVKSRELCKSRDLSNRAKCQIARIVASRDMCTPAGSEIAGICRFRSGFNRYSRNYCESNRQIDTAGPANKKIIVVNFTFWDIIWRCCAAPEFWLRIDRCRSGRYRNCSSTGHIMWLVSDVCWRASG